MEKNLRDSKICLNIIPRQAHSVYFEQKSKFLNILQIQPNKILILFINSFVSSRTKNIS